MTKKKKHIQMRVKLPKGYEIAIEESAKLPQGVLLLVNDQNQKLFVRVGSPKELLEERTIFTILSTRALKGYGIGVEETVNEKLETAEGYIVEESANGDASGDDDDNDLPPEAKKALEARRKKDAGVTINIVGQKPKDGQNGEKEDELGEGFKDILRLRCSEYDVEYTEPKNLTEYRELMHKVQKVEDKKKAEQQADPHGQAGTAPLNPTSNTTDIDNLEQFEFDSYEDMVNTVRTISKVGSKAERAKADKILDKMFERAIEGIKSPLWRGFKLEKESEGAMSTGEILDKINQQLREERQMIKRKEKE